MSSPLGMSSVLLSVSHVSCLSDVMFCVMLDVLCLTVLPCVILGFPVSRCAIWCHLVLLSVLCLPMSCCVTPCHAVSCCVTPCHAVSCCDTKSCHVVYMCHVVSLRVMLCHPSSVMMCYVVSPMSCNVVMSV